MTTIAYRDGILAADTALSRGGTHMVAVTKIVRRADGDMAAVAGIASLIGPFFEWFLGGEDGDPPTVPDEDNSCPTGMIFRAAGHVEVYEAGGWYRMNPNPYMAIGSGRDVALGAMHAGARPQEAVEAAIVHDHGTGGDVTVLRSYTDE